MKLEQSFTVEAPVAAVWSALIDVQRVAPCLPGAEITEAGDDGSYSGSFTVKLGPTTAAYRGTLKLESVDEASRTATMSAKGTDKRGQGGATATIVSTMREQGAATTVDVVTDFAITGRLARFGRSGMIEDISKRLLRDFASCLQATLADEGVGAAEPAAGAPVAPPADAAPAGAPPPADAAPSGAPPPADAAPAAVPPAAAPGGAPPAPQGAPPPPARPAAARPAPQPAKPIKGFSLFLSVLWERVRRLVRARRGR
jgi:uncharacterized protein